MYQIYNAKGKPVGNPAGYKTIASARCVINRRNSKIYEKLCRVAYSISKPSDLGVVLYSIKPLREATWN